MAKGYPLELLQHQSIFRDMSMVIEGLLRVVCHMNDVLIWGKSQAQHNERLHAVQAKIEKAH